MANLENCILLDGDGNEITDSIVFTVQENSGDSAGNTAAQLEPMQFGVDENGEANMLDPGVYKFRISPSLTGWRLGINNLNISGVQYSGSGGYYIPPNTPSLTTGFPGSHVSANSAASQWENGAMGSNDIAVTMHEAVDRVFMHNTSITNIENGQYFSSAYGGVIDPENNMVEVTVVLKLDYVLGSTDLTIDIDIDGDAVDYQDVGGGIAVGNSSAQFYFHVVPYIFSNRPDYYQAQFSTAAGQTTISSISGNLDDSAYEVSPQVTSSMQYEPGVTCCPMFAALLGMNQSIYSDYPGQFAESNDTTSGVTGSSVASFYDGCGSYGEFVRAQYGGNYEDLVDENSNFQSSGVYPSGTSNFGDPWVADFQMTSVNYGDSTVSFQGGDTAYQDININPQNELCRAVQYHNYNGVTNTSLNMLGNTIGQSNLPDSCKFHFRIANGVFNNAYDDDMVDAANSFAAFVWVSYTTANGEEIVHPFVGFNTTPDLVLGTISEINDNPFLISSTVIEQISTTATGTDEPGISVELFFNPNFSFTDTSIGDGSGLLEGSTMKAFVFFVLDNQDYDEGDFVFSGGFTNGGS